MHKIYSIYQIGSIFQWMSSAMFGISSEKCAHNPVTRGDNNCTHWNDFYENKSGLVLLSVNELKSSWSMLLENTYKHSSKNIRCLFRLSRGFIEYTLANKRSDDTHSRCGKKRKSALYSILSSDMRLQYRKFSWAWDSGRNRPNWRKARYYHFPKKKQAVKSTWQLKSREQSVAVSCTNLHSISLKFVETNSGRRQRPTASW